MEESGISFPHHVGRAAYGVMITLVKFNLGFTDETSLQDLILSVATCQPQICVKGRYLLPINYRQLMTDRHGETVTANWVEDWFY